MEASHKKIEHHLKKALEAIKPSTPRSRSGSPIKERKKRTPKEPKEPKEPKVKKKKGMY
jgi:hypothetical protein